MPPVSVQCHNIYLSLHGACVAILTVVSLLHLTCVHLHMYNSVDTYMSMQLVHKCWLFIYKCTLKLLRSALEQGEL